MSTFVPFVSSTPPPLDDESHGDSFFNNAEDDDDDDFGGFASAAPATFSQNKDSDTFFKPISSPGQDNISMSSTEMQSSSNTCNSNITNIQHGNMVDSLPKGSTVIHEADFNSENISQTFLKNSDNDLHVLNGNVLDNQLAMELKTLRENEISNENSTVCDSMANDIDEDFDDWSTFSGNDPAGRNVPSDEMTDKAFSNENVTSDFLDSSNQSPAEAFQSQGVNAFNTMSKSSSSEVLEAMSNLNNFDKNSPIDKTYPENTEAPDLQKFDDTRKDDTTANIFDNSVDVTPDILRDNGPVATELNRDWIIEDVNGETEQRLRPIRNDGLDLNFEDRQSPFVDDIKDGRNAEKHHGIFEGEDDFGDFSAADSPVPDNKNYYVDTGTLSFEGTNNTKQNPDDSQRQQSSDDNMFKSSDDLSSHNDLNCLQEQTIIGSNAVDKNTNFFEPDDVPDNENCRKIDTNPKNLSDTLIVHDSSQNSSAEVSGEFDAEFSEFAAAGEEVFRTVSALNGDNPTIDDSRQLDSMNDSNTASKGDPLQHQPTDAFTRGSGTLRVSDDTNIQYPNDIDGKDSTVQSKDMRNLAPISSSYDDDIDEFQNFTPLPVANANENVLSVGDGITAGVDQISSQPVSIGNTNDLNKTSALGDDNFQAADSHEKTCSRDIGNDVLMEPQELELEPDKCSDNDDIDDLKFLTNSGNSMPQSFKKDTNDVLRKPQPEYSEDNEFEEFQTSNIKIDSCDDELLKQIDDVIAGNNLNDIQVPDNGKKQRIENEKVLKQESESFGLHESDEDEFNNFQESSTESNHKDKFDKAENLPELEERHLDQQIDDDDDFDNFQESSNTRVYKEDNSKESRQLENRQSDQQTDNDDDFDDFTDFQTNTMAGLSNEPPQKIEAPDGGWSAFGGEAETEEDSDWAAFSEPVVAVDKPVETAVRSHEDNLRQASVSFRENLLANFDSALSKALNSCFNKSIQLLQAHDVISLVESISIKRLQSVEVTPSVGSSTATSPSAAKSSKVNTTVDMNVWNNIKVMEETAALKFNWTSSMCNKYLLKATNIDTRNIFVGSKKSMPIYASSLGMLEPNKSPLIPTSLDRPSNAVTDYTPTDTTYPTQEMPQVQFDWTSSGLTNPLDYASQKEKELLESLEVSSPDVTSSVISSTVSIQNLLANSTRSTTVGGSKPDGRKISMEALKILDLLPDLSFMTAKVLMFPLKDEVVES